MVWKTVHLLHSSESNNQFLQVLNIETWTQDLVKPFVGDYDTKLDVALQLVFPISSCQRS